MADRRRTTAYDFSDLRLHPDGTRVAQYLTNSVPQLSRINIQDGRSNWIARDAGGTGKVKQTKKKSKAALEEEEGEFTQKDLDLENLSAEEPEGSAGGKRKRGQKTPHQKTVKRRKFLANEEFLSDAPPSRPSADATELTALSDPSPDLLKYVHRFASQYYTERGQLLNSSKAYRKERKKRKRRLAQKTESDENAGGSDSISSTTESSSSSASGDVGSGDSSQEADSYESSNESNHLSPKALGKRRAINDGQTKGQQKRQGVGRKRSEKQFQDMYKVLDGSALISIGMLVQEYIAHLVNPRIPAHWEEEFRDDHGSEQVEEGEEAHIDNDGVKKGDGDSLIPESDNYEEVEAETSLSAKLSARPPSAHKILRSQSELYDAAVKSDRDESGDEDAGEK